MVECPSHATCDQLLGFKEPACADHHGGTLVPKVDAIAWHEAQLAKEIEALKLTWCQRPPGAEMALVNGFAIAGGGNLEGGGYMVNFGAMAWASTSMEHLVDDVDTPTDDVDEWQARLIRHGRNIPQLIDFGYALQADEAVLVTGLDSDTIVKPAQYQGEQLLWRAAESWRRSTLLGFGRIPEDHPNHGEVRQVVMANTPNSTMAHMAVERGLNGAPLEIHRYYQDAKKNLRSFADALHQMNPDDVSNLQTVAQTLANLREHDAAEPYADMMRIPVAIASQEVQHPDAQAAARLMLLNSPDCEFPFTTVADGFLYFAPHVLWSFSLACLNYVTDEEGLRYRDKAGPLFEELVAKVLLDSGFTGPGGEPVVGRRIPGVEGDVDVFAWNDEEVLIAECKCEMEPPGAWAEHNVANRITDLQDRLDKAKTRLDAAPAWLQASNPVLHGGHGKTIDLPSGLLETRALRSVLISARVEPRFDCAPHAVVTLAGSAISPFLQEVIPEERTMPLWAAPGPVPNNPEV